MRPVTTDPPAPHSSPLIGGLLLGRSASAILALVTERNALIAKLDALDAALRAQLTDEQADVMSDVAASRQALDERSGCVVYVMWGITSGSSTLVFTLGPLLFASEVADIPEAGAWCPA